ncbi:phage antirepressor [Amycolatopsis suaedae]|nr:phage antirepressor KilAC domain-containing protein [Amycolatopsis suaedae]
MDLFTGMGDGLGPEHFGLTDTGRAYVVAGPFAKALGHRDADKATRLLDEEEKGTQIVGTPGGDQRVSVVYEEGIWRLIFRSNLPAARELTKRVTAILRELREKGVVDRRPQRELTRLELIDLARESELGRLAAARRVQELEPKAEAFDRFLTAEGDYAVGTVAKMLGIGQNTLFAHLRAKRVLITGGRRHNTPYEQHAKHFRVVARDFDIGETVRTGYTTYVRPSGIDLIRRLLQLPPGDAAA